MVGRRRAGRKLKKGTRTKSGALSRAADVMQPREDVRSVAMRQRVKHLGLSKEQAATQYAASTHGLLLEKGKLGKDAYEVCERYAECQRRFSVSYAERFGSPRLTGGARCYGEETGGKGEGHSEEWHERVQREFLDTCALFEDRAALGIAVRAVAIKGIEPGTVDEWDKFFRGVRLLAEHWGMPMGKGDE